jgi:hypothetical protein
MTRQLLYMLGIRSLQLPSSIASNANITTGGIDAIGFDSTMLVVDIGRPGEAFGDNRWLKFSFEHSDNNHDYTVISKNLLYSRSALNADNALVVKQDEATSQLHTFGYIGAKRYLRATISSSDNHNAPTCVSLWALLGHPSFQSAGPL